MADSNDDDVQENILKRKLEDGVDEDTVKKVATDESLGSITTPTANTEAAAEAPAPIISTDWAQQIAAVAAGN